ncbi:hypothetical protein M427DRAFT_132190 [Gonapodya prolifera JEL478]|uniref:SH3 domain-containing protein n=1 Tax=Gonapodya prolifera (strain JEL478) TaxID=1344416 RepID=A0A139AQY6_GONPJ|nr:hypothetical protein M427DRAFT_132190 [Gonapodya prolifera JEL478]|eukprot:KXS19160.1 hypothetical protein M427DRAFT_132190 [Gonapodya prolifera JEL478]
MDVSRLPPQLFVDALPPFDPDLAEGPPRLDSAPAYPGRGPSPSNGAALGITARAPSAAGSAHSRGAEWRPDMNDYGSVPAIEYRDMGGRVLEGRRVDETSGNPFAVVANGANSAPFVSGYSSLEPPHGAADRTSWAGANAPNPALSGYPSLERPNGAADRTSWGGSNAPNGTFQGYPSLGRSQGGADRRSLTASTPAHLATPEYAPPPRAAPPEAGPARAPDYLAPAPPPGVKGKAPVAAGKTRVDPPPGGTLPSPPYSRAPTDLVDLITSAPALLSKPMAPLPRINWGLFSPALEYVPTVHDDQGVKRYVARYDHEPECKEELAFRNGQQLDVVDGVDAGEGWVSFKNEGVDASA